MKRHKTSDNGPATDKLRSLGIRAKRRADAELVEELARGELPDLSRKNNPQLMKLIQIQSQIIKSRLYDCRPTAHEQHPHP